MPLHQAVILAIVQAFTEFLPISSSAHLALAPWLLGWKDQGLTFDIALHFGTTLAVIIYFFRDWLQIAAQAFGIRYRPDNELAMNPGLLWLLAAASLPIGIFGLLFEDYAETTWRNPFLIATMLVLLGLLLAYAERISRRTRGIDSIGFKDAMIIGVAQALAIVPGTSLSGITITAGLFRHINRHSAARFSFLLSTPAIVAASAKASYDLYKHGGIPPESRTAFLAGVLVSAVAGCFVIAVFLRFLREHTLRGFAVYRVVFGIIVFALALFFRQPA
jgi:undecaprenyl-diphosphatase